MHGLVVGGSWNICGRRGTVSVLLRAHDASKTKLSCCPWRVCGVGTILPAYVANLQGSAGPVVDGPDDDFAVPGRIVSARTSQV